MVEPVLIEQTAKRWKTLQLWGVTSAIVGLALLFAEPVRAVGIVLALAGLVLVIYARSRAWWHHG